MRQNCPDHGLLHRSNQAIKDQYVKLNELKDGKLSISQSKLNIAQFEYLMATIRRDFLKRNKWISFFVELVPAGLAAIARPLLLEQAK